MENEFFASDFDDHGTLTTEERRALPTSDFGIPQLRKYPMPNADHVIVADAYFYAAPDQYKTELARAILAKAKIFGINVKNPKVILWASK